MQVSVVLSTPFRNATLVARPEVRPGGLLAAPYTRLRRLHLLLSDLKVLTRDLSLTDGFEEQHGSCRGDVQGRRPARERDRSNDITRRRDTRPKPTPLASEDQDDSPSEVEAGVRLGSVRVGAIHPEPVGLLRRCEPVGQIAHPRNPQMLHRPRRRLAYRGSDGGGPPIRDHESGRTSSFSGSGNSAEVVRILNLVERNDKCVRIREQLMGAHVRIWLDLGDDSLMVGRPREPGELVGAGPFRRPGAQNSAAPALGLGHRPAAVDEVPTGTHASFAPYVAHQSLATAHEPRAVSGIADLEAQLDESVASPIRSLEIASGASILALAQERFRFLGGLLITGFKQGFEAE